MLVCTDYYPDLKYTTCLYLSSTFKICKYLSQRYILQKLFLILPLKCLCVSLMRLVMCHILWFSVKSISLTTLLVLLQKNFPIEHVTFSSTHLQGKKIIYFAIVFQQMFVTCKITIFWSSNISVTSQVLLNTDKSLI